MAYAPGVKARMASPLGGEAQPILGCGRLPIGRHLVELSSIEWQDEKLRLVFVTEEEEWHHEWWWVRSKYRGYSREWRHWLASTIPDLKAMKLWDKTSSVEAFVGTKVFIEIGYSEGYQLLRDGDQYVATLEGEPATELGTFEAVTQEMNRAGIPRAYRTITALDGLPFVKENINNYVHNLKETGVESKAIEEA